MKTTLAIFVTTLLAARLAAQEPETAPEPTLVDSILGEFEDLEASIEYGSQNSLIGIHGFFDLVYRNGQNQGSSFDLHHANLLLDVAVNQNADARIEFEWEHGGDSIEADQVYLDYHPFENGTSLIFGRFYAPFGAERHVWYPPTSRTVTRPLAFREVVPGNWYETGAMVRWKDSDREPFFELEGALTNGLGATLDSDPRAARQSTNNNQNLMMSGRAGVNLDLFSCGVSWASGKYDSASKDGFSFLGLDFSLNLEEAEVSGEWVTSTVDTSAGSSSSFDRDGWYVQVYYPLFDETQELGLFSRFDQVDPDSRIQDEADRNGISAGVRWVPSPQVTFKLEYQRVQFDAPGNWPGQDLFALQMILDF